METNMCLSLILALCQPGAGVVEQFGNQFIQLLGALGRGPVLTAVQADVALELELLLGTGQFLAVAVDDRQLAGQVEAIDVDRPVDPDPYGQGQQGSISCMVWARWFLNTAPADFRL